MLRSLLTAALRRPTDIVRQHGQVVRNQPLAIPMRLISSIPSSIGATFFQNKRLPYLANVLSNDLLKSPQTIITQTRTVTKFSLNKGKRKAVKAVIKRFKRLDWGCWIRTHSGRHKKLFKKSPALRRRLKQHVLVNASQSFLLDKMVTKFWRKPKYYIDDIYEPYMKREDYWATKKKPAGF